MTAGSFLAQVFEAGPVGGSGLVRCVDCRRWRPLHRSAHGRGSDAVCCDRAYLVAPSGETTVVDLGADDEDEDADERAGEAA